MRNIVKHVSGILVVALLFLGVSTSALANSPTTLFAGRDVRPTAPCPRIGLVAVAVSVKYKCVKVNKRLVWVAQPAASPTTQDAGLVASQIAEVFAIVNKERASIGLGLLVRCTTLEQAAFLHSQDMNVRDFFSHTNPDGQSPSDRIRLTGFYGQAKSRWTGENIATGFSDAVSVMVAWMDSPSHRANMLNKKFTQLGVGIATVRSDSSYSGYIWTMNFGADGAC